MAGLTPPDTADDTVAGAGIEPAVPLSERLIYSQLPRPEAYPPWPVSSHGWTFPAPTDHHPGQHAYLVGPARHLSGAGDQHHPVGLILLGPLYLRHSEPGRIRTCAHGLGSHF